MVYEPYTFVSASCIATSIDAMHTLVHSQPWCMSHISASCIAMCTNVLMQFIQWTRPDTKEVNLFNEIPTPHSFENRISNSNTDINKQAIKNLHRFALTQKDRKRNHKKMNDNINMNSTIAGSMNVHS